MFSNKNKWFRLVRIYNFIIFVTLLFYGFDCQDPSGQAQGHNNPVGIHITSIEPGSIQINQSFRVYYKYNLSSSVPLRAKVTLYIDELECIVYNQYVGNASGSDDNSVYINSSNFSNSGVGCNTITDLNNKSYKVEIYATEGNYTSLTPGTLIIGTNTFNLRYYNPAEALPNGWNDIVNLYNNDCKTTLVHNTNQNGTIPCITLTGVDSFFAYMYEHRQTLNFFASNFNSSYLVGLCDISGNEFPYNQVGYTINRLPDSTIGNSMVSFVFVNKINSLSPDSGWTEPKKQLLKQYTTAHELGHGRGNIYGHNHDQSYGTHWETCVLYTLSPPNFPGLSPIHYCAKHSNSIKLSWW